MKKVCILLVALFVTIRCSEPELTDKHYPYVVMNEANVTGEGVEFVAEFKGFGETPIKRYGFLWWPSSSTDSSDLFVKEIEYEAAIGSYSFNVNSDLKKDTEYQVRPFAENQFNLVLGNVMVFKSKGTNAAKITGFTPEHGTSGDVITITGSNFSLSSNRIDVWVGTDKGILISNNENEIKFRLPEKLSKSGKVPLVVKSGDVSLQADELFLVDGHAIVDFNPKNGIIGETEIVITGNNFLETGNMVKIGGYELIILSENEKEIKARLPYDMQTGEVIVEVEADGQVATANEKFTIRSRWTRLADFPGQARLDPFSVIVGDYLYVIGGATNTYSDEIWRYDIINDQWLQLPSFPGGGRSGGVGFAIGTTIYYGLGEGSGGISDFWAYNTLTGEWRRTRDFAGVQNPICFSLDGKGYLMGGTWSNVTYSFTEQEGWIYRGYSKEIEITTRSDNYFEIGQDRYVVDLVVDANTRQTNADIYKMDLKNPSSLEFIQRIPFMKKRSNGICFTSNNYAYLGEGNFEYQTPPEFVKLNVTTKEWTRIENFQGGRLMRGAISFSHNSKGFVGFGLVGQGENFAESNQFWMYDPAIN